MSTYEGNSLNISDKKQSKNNSVLEVQFIYFTQIIMLNEGKRGNIYDNSTTNVHLHVYICLTQQNIKFQPKEK